MLARPSDPPDPLSPTRELADLVAMHRHWSALHAPAGAAPTGGVEGLARRVRSGVQSLGGSAGPGPDRQLIGDLIRAVDALAGRCDELGGRLATLEGLVDQVVTGLAADVVRVRARLEASHGDGSDPGPSRSTTGG